MTTIVTGTLAESGATCEASDGVVYGVMVNASGDLCVYDDIMGSPSLGDSDTPTTVHGGGTIQWISAVIDANDLIHIASVVGSVETRDIAYATYNTTTSTLSAWEGFSYDEGYAPSRFWCAIGVDGSQYPWIGYLDVFRYHGSNFDHMYHSEKTGGSWSTREKSDPFVDAEQFVGTTGPLGWGLGGNGVNGNYIYIYWRGTDTFLDIRTRTTSWQGASGFGTVIVPDTGELTSWPAIIVSPDQSVARLYPRVSGGSTYSFNLNGLENSSSPQPDTPYQTFAFHVNRSQPLFKSFAYVEGVTDDLYMQVWEKTFWAGSPSVSKGAQDTGTFLRCVGGYSYDAPPFCNNVMYSNGTTIYGIKLQCSSDYPSVMITHQ